MSKFLKLVENNIPRDNLDAITEVKNLFAKILNNVNGFHAKPIQHKDIVEIRLPSGVKLVVEIKDVVDFKSQHEEEAEDPTTYDDSMKKMSQIGSMVRTAVDLPSEQELKKRKGGFMGFGSDPVITAAIAVRKKAADALQKILTTYNI